MRHHLALITAAFLSYAPPSQAEVGIAGSKIDISPMCGKKPLTVGLADGFGGTTWRRTAIEELRDELSKCSNVKKILYKDARGNSSQANKDITELVAQGVNVLIVFPDFGSQQLPAMREATKAGVTVVPYLVKLEGEPGRDFTANVYEDTFLVGYAWAYWLGRSLHQGNVAFLGGTVDAKSSEGFLAGFKSGLRQFPNLKLVEDKPVVTNWNTSDTEKAIDSLIKKHKKIDAIASDFGLTALAAVKKFEQLGLAPPSITTMASNNELNCKYLDLKRQGKEFPYYTLDGTTTIIRTAVRRGVSEYQGTPNKEPLSLIPFLYADSTARVFPKCMPDAPADADLSSSLTREQLKSTFSK